MHDGHYLDHLEGVALSRRLRTGAGDETRQVLESTSLEQEGLVVPVRTRLEREVGNDDVGLLQPDVQRAFDERKPAHLAEDAVQGRERAPRHPESALDDALQTMPHALDAFDPTKRLSQKLSVGGQGLREAGPGDRIHSLYELIEYGSLIITLFPGDVINNGSGGTGDGTLYRGDKRFLKPGEKIVATIESIGT